MSSTFEELNDKLLSGLRRVGLLAGQIGSNAPAGSGLVGLWIIGLEYEVGARTELR